MTSPTPSIRNPSATADTPANINRQELNDHQILDALLSSENEVDLLDLLSEVGTIETLIQMTPVELACFGFTVKDSIRLQVLGVLNRRWGKSSSHRIYVFFNPIEGNASSIRCEENSGEML